MELKTAIDHSADKYFAVMVTYTARHDSGMRLGNTLKALQEAYTATRSGRAWQYLKADYMLKGGVRTTEITYGKNGWHPHFHELVFVDKSVLAPDLAGSIEEYTHSLSSQLTGLWLDKLSSKGLSGTEERALDVRGSNANIAEYVAKWGRPPTEKNISVNPDEVAYNISKSARGDNLSMMDILYAAADSEKYRNLYREYHAATKGRSQMQWSRGTKAMLDIEILRDELAAQGAETDTDVLLASIGLEDWRYIGRAGYLAQLMTIANEGNLGALENFLTKLKSERENAHDINIQWDLGH